MRPQLKPLHRQVIVITGATSGIGLATAHMAAQRGARTVLVARNRAALEEAALDIARYGAEVAWVEADVSDPQDVERIARTAREQFGGFDSWINNAGVALYGRMDELAIADQRQLFEIDFWGVIYGSLTALGELRERGGAIVNVGSVLSDRAILLQGTYSAAKHAVKAATDALRMEVMTQRWPVSVSLIKPSAIATLYPEHARSLLDDNPGLPPPIYAPSLVAKAILHCCVVPRRELTVGFGGFAIAKFGQLFPRTTDWVMAKVMVRGQQTRQMYEADRRDNLYEPRAEGQVEGRGGRFIRRRSLFLEAQMHPWLAGLTLVALALLGRALEPGLARARRTLTTDNGRHHARSRRSQSRRGAGAD